MKKRMLLAAGAVLVAASVSAFVYVKNGSSSMDGLFNANVEALAGNEGAPDGTVMSYVCKYIGCCGGDFKCFSGSFSISGVELSGTFYMR